MQVSIYLSSDIVRKVDQLAKRERRSRSKTIESLLEASLESTGGGGRLQSLVGTWKDNRTAGEIIAEIYKDRRRHRHSGRTLS